MIKVSETVSIRKIENEIFIFDRKTSTIHSINRVGSFIWELFAENTDRHELVQKICEKFEVDEITAENDFQEFINGLVEKKLITIIE